MLVFCVSIPAWVAAAQRFGLKPPLIAGATLAFGLGLIGGVTWMVVIGIGLVYAVFGTDTSGIGLVSQNLQTELGTAASNISGAVGALPTSGGS